MKLSRTGLRWALEGIVVAHLTVARVAEGLGVAWDTANNAVLAEGKRLLINDPTRFEGVKVIGVDEHVWRHTRRGDKYVTVIIDLTPVRDGAGPARLLDMVECRSKAAFKTWLADRDDAFRDAVEVVAMDGFTGFETAAALSHLVGRRRVLATRAWLVALSAAWVALMLLTPEAAYLVFPLFFLYLHLLGVPLGPAAVVVSTTAAIAAIGLRDGFTLGGIVGPVVGAGVALLLGC